MKINYVKDNSLEIWWCNSHQRFANYIRTREQDEKIIDRIHHCDPKLGGILLPCNCVNITNILEITEN
jgi:hypothetical protein